MKKILIIIFLLFTSIDFTHSKTRQQLVNDALSNGTITSWTAVINSYTFAPDEVFYSKYSTGVASTEWPYVYGGRETAQTREIGDVVR